MDTGPAGVRTPVSTTAPHYLLEQRGPCSVAAQVFGCRRQEGTCNENSGAEKSLGS